MEMRLRRSIFRFFCLCVLLTVFPVRALAEAEGEQIPGAPPEMFSAGTIAVDLMLTGFSADKYSMTEEGSSIDMIKLEGGIGAFFMKSSLLEGIFHFSDAEDIRIIHLGADYSFLPPVGRRGHLDLGGGLGLLVRSADYGTDGNGLRLGAHFGIGTLVKNRFSLGIQGYYTLDLIDDQTWNWFGLRIRVLFFFPR